MADQTSGGRLGGNTRVAVLGHGSIGAVVAARLAAGAVDRATLGAVIGRGPRDGTPVPCVPLEDALALTEVVVECAGQDAVREHAVAIVEAGCDLVLTSIGALADVDLRKRLCDAGPGRVVCTNGAVGGLDMLAAAFASGGLDTVSITSTKKPASLLRPWMSDAQRTEIASTTVSLQVFTGSPDEAARLFPESLNVAVAVDLAVGGLGTTVVELIADPAAPMTRHAVRADGPIGSYTFVSENRPGVDNPRSSAVVPFAVLKTVADLVRQRQPRR
ncbi:aspartate dehydrogenase domain-containing protein [Gordonia sp. CPCC 206044]|uniref:aspartate dehydrogenase domain-containing protein n=1 Tax=Gordonia sp. CPCC 206044 TaxID=3140793 RepID=UPI003AF3F2A6